jgi:hypothetical protein
MTNKNNTAPMGDYDPRLILLDPNDNIFGVARPIRAGEMLMIDGELVQLDQQAGMGFKIAARNIEQGEHILKYGAVIGVANQHITKGQLVHVHNIESTYMANTVTTGTRKEVIS